MSLANSRKTSPPSFAPNGNIGFGHAAVQARSRAWGWLASSSQVCDHSEFHQSFTLIPLAAPATISEIGLCTSCLLPAPPTTNRAFWC